MKIRQHLLARSALTAVALVAAPAFAQTAPVAQDAPAPASTEQASTEDAGAADGQEVFVTGSRIPRPQYEGTIPGAQITGQDIQSRGFNSALEALNDLPLVGPGASPIGNAGGQPSSLGAAFVDLLDLGTNRTLTLVNGRRFVSNNAGTLFVAGNVTGGQVDLNSIPTELIERTDILTVGGAVAYGSDAIAGVVNVILRDDFDGISAHARSGISDKGDLFNYQTGAVVGRNFLGGRGNVTASFQYNHDDGLQGDERADFAPSYIAPTFYLNGAVRNTGFRATLPIDVTGANNGAFLRSTDDGVPGNRNLPLLTGGSILVSESGNVFQFTGTLPTGVTAGSFSAIVGGSQAGSIQSLAGATQVVPGGGVSGATANGLNGNVPSVGDVASLAANVFTRFAPSSLPTVQRGAAESARDYTIRIINTVAPTFAVPGTATDAQLSTLALNLLQSSRPTPREYLAANPNTPVTAFLGSFVPAFLDVPNTGASAAFLPRIAVPLQFNGSGQLVTYNPGVVGATTPATLGGIGGGDFYNPTRYIVLRTEQDRYVGNLVGHFDITDGVTFYTENLYARVENMSLRNAASSNSLSLGGTENAVIIANISNPYLTEAQRATLVASGVATTGATAGLFALSRLNQDVVGENPAFTKTTTYRSVNGLKGDFGLFGRRFSYDASFTYGRAKAEISYQNIRDVEYALALDAVRDGNGNIVCRVQTPGASTALPLGIVNVALVREMGPDGVLVERSVPRTVTAAQVAGCKPLNPFGFNQMTQAAKDYVVYHSLSRNTNEQLFGQATLATASLFDLPGGGVGLAFNGEWRKETLDYNPGAEDRLGASRFAALAATKGSVKSIEGSVEANIPIFGGDLTFPGMQSLEFSPGVRFVRQDGDAPDVRRLNGTLETNEAKGDWETLYTLAGTWRPISDILIRGNVTRSLRQPSVVELFLGNQPAFNIPTDPCGNGQIGSGGFAANRRANCEQEVVRLGIAPDRTAAAAFLNTFVPAGQSLQGGFAGSPNLLPEKGKSWTVGGVLTPRFIPGLSIAADYLNVEVRNQIIPTTLSNAAQFCYDSATFGSTATTLGVNTCSFFDREPTTTGGAPQFNIRNGFASGFINLGALKVRAINGSASYAASLADIVGGNVGGKIRLTANAYHLIDYISSGAGDFSDSQQSAGSYAQPKWETQLTGRYEDDQFFAQWTWNWTDKTSSFNPNTGAFNTIEQTDALVFPAYSLHDASIGMFVGKQFSLQFTVRNIFDKRYDDLVGFSNAASLAPGAQGAIDLLGRRFQATTRLRF